MDVPLQLSGTMIMTAAQLGFNPCFSGCTSSIGVEDEATGITFCVSILVLVDVPLQLGNLRRSVGTTCVSILVLVDVPLQFRTLVFVRQGQRVSILVLVDVPLQCL